MDLKNLPSRYSQSSADEMGGSQNAADLIKAQGPKATTASRPFVVKDIAKAADRPGFITWKSEGHPWFDMEGSAKITGKDVNLDAALQQTLITGTQKQGVTVSQFPNVKPLVVQTPPAVKDAIEKSKEAKAPASELGQAEMSWTNPKHMLYMAGVFSLGLAAGWWLAKRA
jgi:hypothetical protein